MRPLILVPASANPMCSCKIYLLFFAGRDAKSGTPHIYGVIYRKHNRLLGNAELIPVSDWFMNSSAFESLAVSRIPPVNAIYGSLCSNIAYVYMYIDSLPSSSLYSCIVIGDLFVIPRGEQSMRKVLKQQSSLLGNGMLSEIPMPTRGDSWRMEG